METNKIDKLLQYYSQYADQNNSIAQYNLGNIYYYGTYITRDINKAIHYYSLASDQNHSNAQTKLGFIYSIGEYITRDIDKVIHYFSLAANQNDELSQFELGKIYYQGKLVTKSIMKGVDLLIQSANNGYTQSNFLVGYLYHKGERKVLQQSISSAIHYKEASSFNNQYSKNNLGIIHKNGFGNGIQKNPETAKTYFDEAIRQKNDCVSMYNLSHIYIYIDKTDKSIDKSIKLLVKSSNQGFKPSTKLLCLVLLKMFGYNIDKFSNKLSNYSKSVDEIC